ncbi:MAG: DUF1330 domain-containing protein [Pseudomonadota bacterium]
MSDTPPPEDTTPPGYWLVHVTVTDAAAFFAYMRAVRPIFARHEATYLARGGAVEQREGDSVGETTVVVRFPSYAAARACYDSDDYGAAIALREGCATFNLSIVEGIS